MSPDTEHLEEIDQTNERPLPARPADWHVLASAPFIELTGHAITLDDLRMAAAGL